MRFLKRVAEALEHLLDLVRDVPHDPDLLRDEIAYTRHMIENCKFFVERKQSNGDGQGRYEKALTRQQMRLDRLLMYQREMENKRNKIAQLVR